MVTTDVYRQTNLSVTQQVQKTLDYNIKLSNKNIMRSGYN